MTNRIRDGRRALILAAAGLLMTAALAPAQETVFHQGDGMTWTIHNIAVYNQNKAAMDLFTRGVGAASKPLNAWFGKHVPIPMKLHVRPGGCGVGITAGTVTVGDSCITLNTTYENQKWAKYACFFFLGYTLFQPVSAGWPYEVWSDPFNKVIQADLAGEVDGAAGKTRIEAEVDTEPKRRKYQFYRNLRNLHGYGAYPAMWDLMKAENMDLSRIPEAGGMRSRYLLAYLSLALRRKQGWDASMAGIPDVSNAAVMDVLRARNLLLIADRKGKATANAWVSYRAGRPAEVKGQLPQ